MTSAFLPFLLSRMLPQHQNWISCQPNHLWKGRKAIKELRELSEEKLKVIKQWLARQAFWQVHLLAPKRIDRSHYEVMIPNEMHQFSLLYMLQARRSQGGFGGFSPPNIFHISRKVTLNRSKTIFIKLLKK